MHILTTIFADASFITGIKNFDRSLFTRINFDWTNSFLDYVFPVWREALTWIPLYLFLLLFILINFGYKAWTWVIGLVVTIALCDQLSSHLLKPLVQRPRPCMDPLIGGHIHLLLQGCSTTFSFVSSHATNHFGMAFFIIYTLKNYLGNWKWLFIFWAATISYGQVYIGVHYPLDILCGAALGIAIGCLTAWVFNKRFGLPQLRPQLNTPAVV